MWSEIKKIKSDKKQLREFGLLVGGILLLLGGVALWRHKGIYPYFLSIGSILFVLGAVFPAPLKPFQKTWMAFSLVLGFFMSRIILTVLFYFILTPLGLIRRMTGADILDEKIDRSKNSYWKQRENVVKDSKSYENQY